MTRLALLLFLALCLPANAADIRVIDGDTIVVNGEKIRIANIDTPEVGWRAKCPSERVLAQKARNRVVELLTGSEIAIQRGDPEDGRMQDRFGRTLAVVYVDGRDLGLILVNEGLAQLWYSDRKGWC